MYCINTSEINVRTMFKNATISRNYGNYIALQYYIYIVVKIEKMKKLKH